MKTILLTITGLIFFSFSGPETACRRLHTGKFKMISKQTGTVYIYRSRNRQVEIDKEAGIRVMYRVEWPDECTYVLFDSKVIKGDPSMAGNPADTLTVKITSIAEKSYTVLTTSNFSSLEMESELIILKLNN